MSSQVNNENVPRDVPMSQTLTDREAEQATLADEPRPEKAEPVDVEQADKQAPGAHWRAGEVHEVPYK